MDINSKDVSKLIFKKRSGGSDQTFTVNPQMLKVIFEMNGKNTISEVAGKLQIPMNEMRSILQRLIKNKLVQLVESRGPMINGDFLQYLRVQFTEAVGPVAEFLIDDVLSEMGLDKNRIPTDRAVDLIKLLAQESSHHEKKEEFLKNMLNKIVEKGY